MKRWFAGFVLLFLMVCALFLNTALFSARSFQHNLASFDRSSGGIVDIPRLEKAHADIAVIETKIAPLRLEAQQADAKVGAAQRAYDAASDQINLEKAKVMTSLAALEDAAQVAAPAEASIQFGNENVMERAGAISRKPGISADLRSSAQSLLTRAAAVEKQEADLNPLDEKVQIAKSEAQRIADQINTNSAQIIQIQAGFGDNFNRIYNESQAIKRSSFLNLTSTFAGMHPTFVSTILAIIMGALGAILYLFPAYLNPKNEITFVVIVVRLFFGMVTALAFYIVANVTGVALTSGNSGVTMGGDLNPFVVAFLGIIAGIMADDIAKWIMVRGREILGGHNPNHDNGHSGMTSSFTSDPYASAARDAARTAISGSDVGAEPQRGRVMRSGE
jgi:VIT1/CCC1 family predicted Fe2+/Mn2+ transporter